MTDRASYMAIALPAARTALTIADLRRWFRDEAENRARHGILPGTKEYDEIVRECSGRKAGLETMLAQSALNKRTI